MQYREFGKTGVKVSALGLGCMRLPCVSKDDKWLVDQDKAIELIHRAGELGVNYIDTAYGYHDGESEIVVGKALKGQRDKWHLSTKLPPWNVESEDDVRRLLEDQLRKLDTDYIDFYHIHALNKGTWEDKVLKFKIIDKLVKFKDEGLIKHMSFSFHDTNEFLKELVDTGYFETLLCQYNLLDRNYEDAIAHANEKGMGVTIMGPVAGGRLAFPSDVIAEAVGNKFSGTYEIALRFVLGNQNVSCALSGMSSIEQLEANAKVASIEEPLTPEEWRKINKMLDESKKLADLYCTGCNYCKDCPQGIKIAEVFKLMNHHKVYGLTSMAKEEYSKIGKEDWRGNSVTDCIECGKCEDICPQNLNIIEKLKEVESELGA